MPVPGPRGGTNHLAVEHWLELPGRGHPVSVTDHYCAIWRLLTLPVPNPGIAPTTTTAAAAAAVTRAAIHSDPVSAGDPHCRFTGNPPGGDPPSCGRQPPAVGRFVASVPGQPLPMGCRRPAPCGGPHAAGRSCVPPAQERRVYNGIWPCGGWFCLPPWRFQSQARGWALDARCSPIQCPTMTWAIT